MRAVAPDSGTAQDNATAVTVSAAPSGDSDEVAAHRVVVDFTSMSEPVELGPLGLWFESQHLELDYQRFLVRGGLLLPGAMIAFAVLIFIGGQATAGLEGRAIRPAVAGSIFAVAGIAGFVAVRVVNAPRRERWHAALAVAFTFAMLSAVIGIGAARGTCVEDKRARLRGFGDDSIPDACTLTIDNGFVVIMWFVLAARMRALHAVIVQSVITVAAIVMNLGVATIAPQRFSALSAALITLFMAALWVFMAAIAVTHDRVQRDEFLLNYRRQQARVAIESHRAHVRTLGQLVLPRHLMTLVDGALDLSDVQHRGEQSALDAAVCVTAVANYHQWTHGLLPAHVVGILSSVFETLDALCEAHSVTRVVMFGDRFVVECGLMEKEPVAGEEAHRRCREFAASATTISLQAGSEAAAGASQFLVAGVARGEVSGRVVGVHLLRFVVYGAACDAAIAECQARLNGTSVDASPLAPTPLLFHIAEQRSSAA